MRAPLELNKLFFSFNLSRNSVRIRSSRRLEHSRLHSDYSQCSTAQSQAPSSTPHEDTCKKIKHCQHRLIISNRSKNSRKKKGEKRYLCIINFPLWSSTLMRKRASIRIKRFANNVWGEDFCSDFIRQHDVPFTICDYWQPIQLGVHEQKSVCDSTSEECRLSLSRHWRWSREDYSGRRRTLSTAAGGRGTELMVESHAQRGACSIRALVESEKAPAELTVSLPAHRNRFLAEAQLSHSLSLSSTHTGSTIAHI